MEWISVKKKPKESCQVLVIHKHYHAYKPIEACYDENTKCFTFGPHNYLLPSTIALDITHYILIPDVPKE